MTIRQLRKNLLLTQIELAKQLGVSKQTVHYWEIGDRKPNNEMRRKINKLATDNGWVVHYGD